MMMRMRPALKAAENVAKCYAIGSTAFIAGSGLGGFVGGGFSGFSDGGPKAVPKAMCYGALFAATNATCVAAYVGAAPAILAYDKLKNHFKR